MTGRRRRSDAENFQSGASGEHEPSLEEAAPLEEAQRLAARRYFIVSRSPSASLLFVLPLLLIYELGVLLVRADINAAAIWFKTPLSWLGRNPVKFLGVNPTLVLNAILIVAVLIAAWRLGRLGALHGGTFLGMFLESCAYALLIGPLVILPLTGRLGFAPFSLHLENLSAKLFASAGAGLYEELVFRFVLLGSIYFTAKRFGKMRPLAAGALGLLISGALFSAAHFLSPGESVNPGAFLYRLGAGTVLGIVFLTRGFGIAAWTHALYDVYVLCFTAT